MIGADHGPRHALLLLGQGAGLLVLFLALFVIAKYLHRLLARYDVEQQLTGADNLALATSLGGYYVGFAIVFCGAYLGPSYGVLRDLLLVGGYTLLGLVLLNVARYLNDVFILPTFSVTAAIRDQRNAAAGVILGSNYIASALIVAGSIYGVGGGLASTLVFYALGQLALVLFSWLYERLTPYVVQEQIKHGNLAAGLGFGGALIALAVVIMAAVGGDFVGWGYNLGMFVVDLSGIFVYLVLVRLFFDKIILGRADLNAEIAVDRNVGAGLLEFAVAVSFAAVLFLMIR